jgi:hypothetical protein
VYIFAKINAGAMNKVKSCQKGNWSVEEASLVNVEVAITRKKKPF